MRLFQRMTRVLSLLVCLALPVTAQNNADWMSGGWGVGYRIPAGGQNPPLIDNLHIPFYDVDGFVQQVASVPGLSWVIVNLSAGAYGDLYMAWHSVLTNLNPGSTPLPPDEGGRDLFMELALALQANGIRVIAYVAAQGPAMLKHPTRAFDYNATCACSPSVQRWEAHVQQEYGNSLDPTLKLAFAEIILEEYAERYSDLVDGWWFDQGTYADISAVYNVVMTHNPNAVVAFNVGQKVPLVVNSPGYEHYTGGHPTPLKNADPNDSQANEGMITSVEGTLDGFLDDGNGNLSLGHVYMPVTNGTWNSPFKPVVWDVAQAAEWKSRVQAAGGAWTWNIPRDSNGATLSLLDTDHVQFVQDVEDFIFAPSSAPSAAPSASLAPSAAPPLPDAMMESMVVSAVTDQWVAVPLSPGFSDPVPVCTVRYEGVYVAIVVRMRNVTVGSFEIRLQNPRDIAPLAARDVHCLVVDEGSWLMPDGRTIEAQSYTSTLTDRKNQWWGQPQSYLHSYTKPIVLGQVLSFNDSLWSVFWCRGHVRPYAPSPTSLFTGKHIGEDLAGSRLDEQIGFIVVEAGHGTADYIEYEADLTIDKVTGYGNRAKTWSHSYAQAFGTAPAVSVLSQAAMDGVDGSWAVLAGTTNESTLGMATDEDKVTDSENAHTHEEVGYIAFGEEGPIGLISNVR